MDRIRKRLQDLSANPSNCRASELIALLEAAGATPHKKGGSHHTYRYPGMYPITVVFHRESQTLRRETVETVIQWVEEVIERKIERKEELEPKEKNKEEVEP